MQNCYRDKKCKREESKFSYSLNEKSKDGPIEGGRY